MKKKKNKESTIPKQTFINESHLESEQTSELIHTETEPAEEDEIEYTHILIPFSGQDEERLLLAMSLAIDIFADPNTAQAFSENPNTYMENRNLAYEGDMDFGILQMALAFADDEIRHAVENHDVELFMTLCQDRGILAIPFGVENIDMNQMRQALEVAGVSQNDIDIIVELFIWVPVALIFLLVVLTTAGIIADVYAAMELKLAVLTDDYVVINGPDSYYDMQELNPSPIALWMTIGEHLASDQMVLDEVAENYYTRIDSYLSAHSEEYNSNENYRDCIQRLVKSNLIHAMLG